MEVYWIDYLPSSLRSYMSSRFEEAAIAAARDQCNWDFSDVMPLKTLPKCLDKLSSMFSVYILIWVLIITLGCGAFIISYISHIELLTECSVHERVSLLLGCRHRVAPLLYYTHKHNAEETRDRAPLTTPMHTNTVLRTDINQQSNIPVYLRLKLLVKRKIVAAICYLIFAGNRKTCCAIDTVKKFLPNTVL